LFCTTPAITEIYPSLLPSFLDGLIKNTLYQYNFVLYDTVSQDPHHCYNLAMLLAIKALTQVLHLFK